MFTIDKLIGTVVKQVCPMAYITCRQSSDMSEQVQTILSDNRSQDIFDLLRKERDLASPSTQDLINARKNTERVLGPDENLFRMVWVRYIFYLVFAMLLTYDSCRSRRRSLPNSSGRMTRASTTRKH